MTWFLRLFPAYRALEASLRAVSESRTRLQDQLLEYRAKYEAAIAESAKLLIQQREEAQRTIDFFAFSLSGRTVHGNTPAPGVLQQNPPEPVPRRPHGRDLVRQGYEQFSADLEREYRESIKRANEPAAS
jgi:hypothetical protein